MAESSEQPKVELITVYLELVTKMLTLGKHCCQNIFACFVVWYLEDRTIYWEFHICNP